MKFDVSKEGRNTPYAVIWIKKSTQLVIGLALPEDVQADNLAAPPTGFKYPLLTKYLTVTPGSELPPDFPQWARLAQERVSRGDGM